MKKIKGILLLALIFLLVACSGNNGGTEEVGVIKIGVSPVPHGDIVRAAEDKLKEEGIEIEIIEYSDYIVPNTALDQGDIDLNYFQHIPYLESFVEDNDLDLISLGPVHIEPMGVYSAEYDSLEELPEGGEIYLPNDPANMGRALALLEAEGLIKLKEGVGVEANEGDIVENTKNLKFTPVEAAIVPTVYKDGVAGVINGNYALEHDLNPVKDTIALEDAQSPYTNVLAARTEDKDNEVYLKILEVLQSDEVTDFINEEYEGAVIPAH